MFLPLALGDDGAAVQQPARRSLVVSLSDVSAAPTELDATSEEEVWRGSGPPSSGASLPPSSGAPLPPGSGVSLPPGSGVSLLAPLPPSSGVSLLAPPSLDLSVEQPALSTHDWWSEEVAFHGHMNGPSSYDLDPVPTPELPEAAEDAYTRSEEQQQRYARSRSPPRRSARSYELATISIPTQTQSTYELCACRVRRALARGAMVYIGITENFHRRWEEHSTMWDYMVVLLEARTSQITAQLERQLLSEFRERCQNLGPGGERASCGSPHYLYMVVRLNGLIRQR